MAIENLITFRNAINLIDILVVWFVIYRLMLLLRGTRAVQLMRGVAIVIIIKLFSAWIGFNTVSWIMNQIINWG